MAKTYRYVGSTDRERLPEQASERVPVRTREDLERWVESQPEAAHDFEVVAAFVVDAEGALWIGDRHSEHVVLAQGGDVLAAGEVTFRKEGPEWEAGEVTNQSTGYCPEPDSWPAVEAALSQAGIADPGEFTTGFAFRRCDNCHNINLVKDDWFYCALCDSELSPEWNID